MAIEKCASGIKPNANVNVRVNLTVRSINCNYKDPSFRQQLRNILKTTAQTTRTYFATIKSLQFPSWTQLVTIFASWISNVFWRNVSPLPTKSVAGYCFTCFTTTSYLPETSLRRKQEREIDLDWSLSTSSGFQRIPPIIMSTIALSKRKINCSDWLFKKRNCFCCLDSDIEEIIFLSIWKGLVLSPFMGMLRLEMTAIICGRNGDLKIQHYDPFFSRPYETQKRQRTPKTTPPGLWSQGFTPYISWCFGWNGVETEPELFCFLEGGSAGMVADDLGAIENE